MEMRDRVCMSDGSNVAIRNQTGDKIEALKDYFFLLSHHRKGQIASFMESVRMIGNV